MLSFGGSSLHPEIFECREYMYVLRREKGVLIGICTETKGDSEVSLAENGLLCFGSESTIVIL